MTRDPLSLAPHALAALTLPFDPGASADDDLRRLRTLVENLPAGVLVEDEAGRIVVVNARFCELWDVRADPAALVGAERASIGRGAGAPVADPDGFAARVDELLAAREPALDELIPLADGRTYERDFVPIWSDDVHRGHLWVFWDMTERLRAAAELEAARDAAVDAARAKADFVAMMSHEIRTPMNGIVGTLELLRQTGLTREQDEMLDLIEDSATVLRAQLDDVLDLSRIEAGRFTLERLPFALGDVLRRTVAVQRPEALQRGLALELELDPALPEVVLGDPGRLRQVLHNLVSNALKFTAEGRVVVAARVLAVDADVTTVRLEVRDTGIGIDAGALAELWQPFRQADVSTRRRYGGTGLGLSIVRRLVERAGGTVDAVSRPGSGSTFGVVLPLEHADALPADPRDDVAEPVALAGRVLVVEDQRTNRQIAARQLAVLGVEADAVADGSQAVEAVQRGGYALVLMDCQMPVMDGFAATRAIRALDGPVSAIPIIALTANAMEGDRERCLAAGMDWYLAKPVGLDELRAALGTFLGSSAASPPAEPPVPAVRPTTDGVDTEALRGLADDLGLEGLEQVVEDYLSELPAQVRAVAQAAADREAVGLIRAAHALKSPSRALGLVALADACGEIEVRARGEELGDLTALVTAVDAAGAGGAHLLRDALAPIRESA